MVLTTYCLDPALTGYYRLMVSMSDRAIGELRIGLNCDGFNYLLFGPSTHWVLQTDGVHVRQSNR